MNLDAEKYYLEGINRVQDYIETHLDAPLKVEELSRIAAFSEYHFLRIYSCFTGETLYGFVKRLRLEKATYLLLAAPERSITDIALSVGFANPASFAKAFKLKYGVSARDYRKQNGPIEAAQFVSRLQPKPGESIAPTEVDIRDEPAQQVIYLRYTGPYKEDSALFLDLFTKLYEWADKRALISERTRWFVIYHNFGNETDEEQLRLSVCMSVDGNVAVEGPIGCFTLSGGRYGVGRFWVNALEYGKAWHHMYATWLPISGYRPDDRFAFEHYPPSKLSKDRRRVEIYIPIVKP